jgi:hypothetical protein
VGKLSTGWSNYPPKVNDVNVLGRLFTNWLNLQPKVSDVNVLGKLPWGKNTTR